MGLLKFLGIEKYLKKVKKYVDDNKYANYITSFTVEDLKRSYENKEFINLPERDDMLKAAVSNKLILVPNKKTNNNGYSIMILDGHTDMAIVITGSGEIYGFNPYDNDFLVENEWYINTLNSAFMKYLENPYVINNNVELPEDLRNLIITGGYPNKNIFKLCLLNVDRDGDGEYWLESISSLIDDTIVSASGKYFFFEENTFYNR